MSTKNFVSYGDAETLMSGIKSAIDDAGGGGGGSLEKVVVSSFTDTSYRIGNALTTFYQYISNLTEEQLRCSFIDIYSNGYDNYRMYYYKNDPSSHYYDYHSSKTANGLIQIIASTSVYAPEGTDRSAYSLNDMHIAKIELCYMEYRSAVVPSGGDTLVHEITDGSKYLGASLNTFYSIINNLTAEERKNCYLLIQGTGRSSYQNYATEARLPFVAKLIDNSFVFGDNVDFLSYINSTGSTIKLSGSANVSNEQLTNIGISRIALYK